MTFAERFTEALERAGYKNPADFARQHDLTDSTVRSHANGTRVSSRANAQRYAKILGVDWRTLYLGEISETPEEPTTSPIVGPSGIDERKYAAAMKAAESVIGQRSPQKPLTIDEAKRRIADIIYDALVEEERSTGSLVDPDASASEFSKVAERRALEPPQDRG